MWGEDNINFYIIVTDLLSPITTIYNIDILDTFLGESQYTDYNAMILYNYILLYTCNALPNHESNWMTGEWKYACIEEN